MKIRAGELTLPFVWTAFSGISHPFRTGGCTRCKLLRKCRKRGSLKPERGKTRMGKPDVQAVLWLYRPVGSGRELGRIASVSALTAIDKLP